MRTVDADKIKEEISNQYELFCGLAGKSESTKLLAKTIKLLFIQVIDNASTLEESVGHGRWEWKEDPYGFFDAIPVCSVCNCTTKYRETSAYCPNCGAKMGEEDI